MATESLTGFMTGSTALEMGALDVVTGAWASTTGESAGSEDCTGRAGEEVITGLTFGRDVSIGVERGIDAGVDIGIDKGGGNEDWLKLAVLADVVAGPI